MCIACVLPKGTKLSEDEFDNCWSMNPDGGGFTYPKSDGSGFEVFKSMNRDELKKLWKEHHTKLGETTPFMLHFRIGSHGVKDVTNVHPFHVNPGVIMCHNGIIQACAPDKDDNRSDTRIFAEDVVGALPQNFLRNKGQIRLIYSMIGSNNKVVFLNTRGKFSIFNIEKGEDDNGRWFSNTSYKRTRSHAQTQFGNEYYWEEKDGTKLIPSQNKGSQYKFNSTNNSSAKDSNHAPGMYPFDTLYECPVCRKHFIRAEWNYTSDICNSCDEMCKGLSKVSGISEYTTRAAVKAAAKAHDWTPRLFQVPMATKEPSIDKELVEAVYGS